MNETTASVGARINPRPALRITPFEEEFQVVPGTDETISLAVENMGNVTDTIIWAVTLPPSWALVEMEDTLTLSPEERVVSEMSFTVPEGETPEVTVPIEIEARSLAAERFEVPFEQKVTTRAHVLKPRRKRSAEESVPKFPINVGFSMNRMEEGRIPETALFLSTGEVEMGDLKAELEVTEKSEGADRGATPRIHAEHLKINLGGEWWSVRLGDALIQSNPLTSQRTVSPMADYQPLGEIARGGRLTARLAGTDVTLFRGKRLFSDDGRYTLLTGQRDLNENLSASATYLNRDGSHIFTLEGDLDSLAGRSYSGLLGLSSWPERDYPVSPAAQVRGVLPMGKATVMGRLHWSGKSFAGRERAKVGAVVTSRWVPDRRFYVWGNVQLYRQSWPDAVSDSAATVIDVMSRLLLNRPSWPSMNIGFNLRRDAFDHGKTVKRDMFNFRLQNQTSIGLPSVGLLYQKLFRPDRNVHQKETELKLGWMMYRQQSRAKLEQRFQRVDRHRWGGIFTVDVGTTVRGLLLNLFYSGGKVWRPNYLGEVKGRTVSNYGVRSNFGIQPFGKDYNVTFELGKVATDFDELTADWRFSISLSGRSVPRFYVPVPSPVRTTGTVSGEIFIDKNGDGIRSADEAGLAQVLLFMRDEDALTEADGSFEFSPAETGEYPFSIDEATIPAYLSLAEEAPKTISVRRGGAVVLQIPLVAIGTIEGVVFIDQDDDNRMGRDEAPLPTVRVVVHRSDGREWEAFTDREGRFVITDLVPDSYSVMLDERWLPKRTEAAISTETVILDPRDPRAALSLPVVKKKLEIRRTFSRPKKD